MIPIHALFQRRIDGDHALLDLARLRFDQAGLAAEVYGGSDAQLSGVLGFAPSGPRLPMVHLPRDINLLDPGDAARIIRLAERFRGRVSGFVVHDRQDLPDRLPELTRVAAEVSDSLAGTGEAVLFIEYAAGMLPEQFVSVGEALSPIERVALCVDSGHVGITAAEREFVRLGPDLDRGLTSLSPDDPRLPDLIGDVQSAVGAGLDVLLGLIEALTPQAKPIHFHLHDGHPLLPGPPSDHWGFLLTVPLPFRYGGKSSAEPLYGPGGLRRIVHAITDELGPDRASITLEIHQHQGRLPLPEEDAERLFTGWTDLTNAERMNLWLRELADNASLVRAG